MSRPLSALRNVVARAVPRPVKEVLRAARTEWSAARVRAELGRIARGRRPVVLGPWVSEMGFEVLYWIPFLRWAFEAYGIRPERAVVLSRGGTASWYGSLAGRYLEVFDLVDPQEFKRHNQARLLAQGVQKHKAVSDFDRVLVERARAALGAEEADCLHPSLMYNLFEPFWDGSRPWRFLERFTRYRPLERGPQEAVQGLPERYVVAKFYFSEAFPDTPANRQAVNRIIDGLAARTEVVLLHTDLEVDDHFDLRVDSRARVHLPPRPLAPRENLALQSAIMAGADWFIGTYGGFSYLPLLYGIPTVALHSSTGRYLTCHLEAAQRAADCLRGQGGAGHRFSHLEIEDVRKVSSLIELGERSYAAR